MRAGDRHLNFNETRDNLAQLFITLLRTSPKRLSWLSLYAVLRELQMLLATWTGTCAVCGFHIDSHLRAPTY